MKNKILLCSICALFFFSCKKEKKTSTSEKLYPIAFNLTGFTQTQIPIGKTKPASLTPHAVDSVPIAQLNYVLFDGAGTKVVSQRVSHKGDASFGVFTDRVPAGNYNAIFYGGSDSLHSGSSYYGYVFAYNNAPGSNGFPCPWDDTFYKKVPITVDDSGTINQNVALDRITGRLDIVIKDAIPVGSTKIYVSFIDTCMVKVFTGQGVLIDQFGAATNITTRLLNAADAGKLNYTITMYTLNNKPFNLTINYSGSAYTEPITKAIKNVVCKRNYRTILSGNLFSPDNSSFDITIDPVWNTPVTGNF